MIALIFGLVIVLVLIALFIRSSNKENTNPDYENWKNKQASVTKESEQNILYKSDQNKKPLNDCVAKNNEGIKHEKSGNIEAAIKVYESNIQEGCYPARHSFDRLMVLYRKSKDYNNEIRVIKRAIDVFPEDTKYKDRLQKTNTLLL